jgi:DinB superfamily
VSRETVFCGKELKVQSCKSQKEKIGRWNGGALRRVTEAVIPKRMTLHPETGEVAKRLRWNRRRDEMVRRVMGVLILMVVAGAAAVSLELRAQSNNAKPAPTLKSILLEQLKSTHTNSEWFVCADVAVAGLTPEQANWADGKGNHSVGQLVYHVWFWNMRNLEKMKGETLDKYSGNNDETFEKFDGKSWPETVQKMDAVMSELEQLVESADDAKLAQIAPTIQRINAHNAYHLGEIVMVRKEQGAWDASKGVK